MTVRYFGVVYSATSGQIRRYIYWDDDASGPGNVVLLPGEALVEVSRGPYANSAQWQAAINSAVTVAAGVAPGNPRCAVIDSSGNVVDMINADPAIDSIPGMTLVLTQTADIGWTWSAAGGFVTPPPVPPPIK
jgi:hypothetical protein